MRRLRRSCFVLLVLTFGAATVLGMGGALSQPPTARALPEAGTDTLDVDAQVSAVSRLGSETVSLSGTVTIERGDPRMEDGVEVVDAEIVALDLRGTSLTGSVVVRESPTRVSSGQIRSLQPPPDQFPASSFFDVFVEVDVPASPTPVLRLHNEVPFHVVPVSGGSEVPLDAWPPTDVTYLTEPDPCTPLLPRLPAEVCVTSLSVLIAGPASTPTATATPSPTSTLGTPTTPGPTPTRTPTPTPGTTTALVHINPPTMVVPETSLFTVSIQVDDVADLAAFEFEMAFDPDLLDFVSVSSGPFLGSSGRTVTCLPPQEEPGIVRFGCVSTGATPGASGSGTLATLTLQAGCPGNSDLTLTRVGLAEPLGRPIASQAEDGGVTISGGPCVTPSPTSTPDAAMETPTATAPPVTPTSSGANPSPTSTVASEVLSLPDTGAAQPRETAAAQLPAALLAGLAACFGLTLVGLSVRRLRHS